MSAQHKPDRKMIEERDAVSRKWRAKSLDRAHKWQRTRALLARIWHRVVRLCHVVLVVLAALLLAAIVLGCLFGVIGGPR